MLGAERFLREIEIAARLNHPHILPLHDSGCRDREPSPPHGDDRAGSRAAGADECRYRQDHGRELVRVVPGDDGLDGIGVCTAENAEDAEEDKENNNRSLGDLRVLCGKRQLFRETIA